MAQILLGGGDSYVKLGLGAFWLKGSRPSRTFEDIREYLKNEKKVSEEGIAQVSALMPVFASDFVAYKDMKAYLIDEDADLQETNQDLELIDLIGVKNWLVQKLNGTATV